MIWPVTPKGPSGWSELMSGRLARLHLLWHDCVLRKEETITPLRWNTSSPHLSFPLHPLCVPCCLDPAKQDGEQKRSWEMSGIVYTESSVLWCSLQDKSRRTVSLAEPLPNTGQVQKRSTFDVSAECFARCLWFIRCRSVKPIHFSAWIAWFLLCFGAQWHSRPGLKQEHIFPMHRCGFPK